VKETSPFIRRYAAAILVFALGVAGSLLGHRLVIEHEQKSLVREFHSQASHGANRLKQLCVDQEQTIEELRDLVREGQSVFDAANFARLTDAVIGRHPHTMAVAWCPRLMSTERASFEQAVHTSGLGTYAITQGAIGALHPAINRPEHVPVLFLKNRVDSAVNNGVNNKVNNSPDKLPITVGYDLTSVGPWKTALSYARTANESVVLPGFKLTVPEGLHPGLAIAIPLAHTMSEGIPEHGGYLLGVSSIADLAEVALGAFSDGTLMLSLVDEASSPDTPSIYSMPMPMPGSEMEQEIQPHLISITVADRKLSLTCRPSARFVAEYRSHAPLALLCGGLILTFIATIGLAIVGFHAGMTDRIITRSTKELRAKITEHARSEVALSVALSENVILAAAISNTTAAVTISDPMQRDNPLIFVNRAFGQLTGHSTSEVIGRNPRFLYGEKTEAKSREEISAAMREGKPVRVELQAYRKDGTTWWNDLSITPVNDDYGKLVYWVGIHNDVSEQKLASLALRRERDRLRRQLGFANAIASAAEVVVAGWYC